MKQKHQSGLPPKRLAVTRPVVTLFIATLLAIGCGDDTSEDEADAVSDGPGQIFSPDTGSPPVTNQPDTGVADTDAPDTGAVDTGVADTGGEPMDTGGDVGADTQEDALADVQGDDIQEDVEDDLLDPPDTEEDIVDVVVVQNPCGMVEQVNASTEFLDTEAQLPGSQGVPQSCYSPPPFCVVRDGQTGVGGAEVVFRVTARSAGAYYFSTALDTTYPENAADTVIYLYAGDAPIGDSLVMVDSRAVCNDDIGPGYAGSAVTYAMEADETVYVVVDGWDANSNGRPFELEIDTVAAQIELEALCQYPTVTASCDASLYCATSPLAYGPGTCQRNVGFTNFTASLATTRVDTEDCVAGGSKAYFFRLQGNTGEALDYWRLQGNVGEAVTFDIDFDVVYEFPDGLESAPVKVGLSGGVYYPEPPVVDGRRRAFDVYVKVCFPGAAALVEGSAIRIFVFDDLGQRQFSPSSTANSVSSSFVLP